MEPSDPPPSPETFLLSREDFLTLFLLKQVCTGGGGWFRKEPARLDSVCIFGSLAIVVLGGKGKRTLLHKNRNPKMIPEVSEGAALSHFRCPCLRNG
ncbi:hypothetical protein NPIL_333701 [Nephila pilipes]|uniref:Uncharacterized protein n=1 Tax=Nephila pilipes TaxID=299642 RepID=A0A8X6IJE4_NEPPI|nr:hypothetical protein NPIL_333701 [Nephila pilipes]